MVETCKGCDGTGVVIVSGPFSIAAGWSPTPGVRETCVCGECNGTGSVER